MRVAALFDVHGNLPALEAVLGEVRREGFDAIVVGGDVLPGPMPVECLRLLFGLEVPVHFLRGNGDLAVVAQREARRTGVVSYWGTSSGRPLPEADLAIMRWNAEQLDDGLEAAIRAWPFSQRLTIDGLGDTFFCHATPRSEVEIFTRLTAGEKLRPLFDGLGADVVVCGHTHLPFDRTVGTARVINPGSVGQPFGEPGAYWAELGPSVRLRRTEYDLEGAAERIRATSHPRAAKEASSVLRPPDENEILQHFASVEVGS